MNNSKSHLRNVLSFALCFLIAMAVQNAVAAGIVVVGSSQVVATSADSNAAGSAEAFKATAISSGSIAAIMVYVETGSNSSTLVEGLYTDAAGHPGALTFSATVGGAFPPPANLSVSNSGSGSLSFTAVANQAWLQLSPLSGTVPNNIQVSAVTAGLSAGTYTGQITVTGSSGTTKTVSATLPLIPTRGRSACQWPGWGVALHLGQKSSGEYDCYNYGNA